ncbi:hypothetical protein UNDYM_5963 (plasmid) [Undibacterium sp. YM2]|uniref:hypothetical protein n=1 Tax=Undibacterium sp. YM2 TaxID=2058625 RepID=UPI001331EC41|nr:hypothetical protein [Undibacterium sp. YM2]BBB70216.1 hypothetical protein UNDYM_5963 [Undibacterium sp. YM2]
MSRNSNDDRSNSMNPNNDAYHASEANRNNQIGAYDNDDVELSDSEKQQRAVSSETQSNAYNRGIAGICDALLSISQQTQNEKAENTISSDGLLARTTLTESSCGEVS